MVALRIPLVNRSLRECYLRSWWQRHLWFSGPLDQDPKPKPAKADIASYKERSISRYIDDQYIYPLEGWMTTCVRVEPKACLPLLPAACRHGHAPSQPACPQLRRHATQGQWPGGRHHWLEWSGWVTDIEGVMLTILDIILMLKGSNSIPIWLQLTILWGLWEDQNALVYLRRLRFAARDWGTGIFNSYEFSNNLHR